MPQTQSMPTYSDEEKCAHYLRACHMCEAYEILDIQGNEVYIAVHKGKQFIWSKETGDFFDVYGNYLDKYNILFKKGDGWFQWFSSSSPLWTPDSPQPYPDLSQTETINQANWTRVHTNDYLDYIN